MRANVLRVLVLFSWFLFPALVACAETYYVSLQGDDISNGKTEATAFRTIKKGVSVLNAGDTVLIKSGNYGDEHAVLRNSGRKDAPIVIKAERPGEVILDGKKRGTGLTMDSKSYVVVEGLKFTRYSLGVRINQRCSYITVKRCIFLDNYWTGIVLNDGVRDPKTCHHHLFTENQFLDPGPRNNGYGLRMYSSSNVEVVNNYFHGLHTQACSFKARMVDCRVAGNVFEGFHFSAIQLGQNSDWNVEKLGKSIRSYRLVAEGNIFRPAPGYRAKSAIVVCNVTDAVVRNNFIDSIYGEDKKAEGKRFFPGAGIHVTPLAAGTKIYGNLLVNIKEPKPALMIRADCEIFNNTIAGCARGLVVAKGIKAMVRNNIFYKNGQQVGVAEPLQDFYVKYYGYVMNDNGVMAKLPVDTSQKSVFNYNLWFPDWKGKGPHGISADPGFLGPIKALVIKSASPEFTPNFQRMKAYRLKKGSPCLDKGVWVGMPFAGAAPDLGAFEFGR